MAAQGLMARVVQKILVLVHVVSIHALFIQQWSRKLVPKRKVHLGAAVPGSQIVPG